MEYWILPKFLLHFPSSPYIPCQNLHAKDFLFPGCATMQILFLFSPEKRNDEASPATASPSSLGTPGIFATSPGSLWTTSQSRHKQEYVIFARALYSLFLPLPLCFIHPFSNSGSAPPWLLILAISLCRSFPACQE